jgi:hypothetical protein
MQIQPEQMQIEKPEIMSPLTNEDVSDDDEDDDDDQKENKNDKEIDELLKNIDTKIPEKNVI